jgi:flagellar basal-body rod protein FlgC
MADVRINAETAQAIAASALRAQQGRMRIIAENLANANSTSKVKGGDPYRRQEPVFEPTPVAGGIGVRMTRARPDSTAFKLQYEPGNPSADASGYVKLPNVDPLIEALDMRDAQKAYEANLNVIDTARTMEMRTLDLLKK